MIVGWSLRSTRTPIITTAPATHSHFDTIHKYILYQLLSICLNIRQRHTHTHTHVHTPLIANTVMIIGCELNVCYVRQLLLYHQYNKHNYTRITYSAVFCQSLFVLRRFMLSPSLLLLLPLLLLLLMLLSLPRSIQSEIVSL